MHHACLNIKEQQPLLMYCLPKPHQERFGTVSLFPEQSDNLPRCSVLGDPCDFICSASQLVAGDR